MKNSNKYVELVEETLNEIFVLEPTSEKGKQVKKCLFNVIKCFLVDKVKKGENILVQDKQFFYDNIQDIKNDLNEVSKYLLVAKKPPVVKKRNFRDEVAPTEKQLKDLESVLVTNEDEDHTQTINTVDIGLTKKGFKFATGGSVKANNEDITDDEFIEYRKQLNQKIKDKNHPLNKKKGWIELLLVNVNDISTSNTLRKK